MTQRHPEARRLHALGFKLVELHPMSKRPVGEGWNLAPVAGIRDEVGGYGLLLAANGLCSVDPDNEPLARAGLKRCGFDLDAILRAGVRTTSTRPGSGGRVTFRMPGDTPLRWIRFSSRSAGTLLELRAASANLQDSLPGTVYLDAAGGGPWAQQYATDRRLDDAPPPPDDLVAWWARLSADAAYLREQQRLFVGPDAFLAVSSADGSSLGFPSPLRAPFNDRTDVASILSRHGYTRHGDRWAPSTASGAPAVRPVPERDGLWHSDHASDPLSGTFDAWTAFVVLDHAHDLDAAESAFRATLDAAAVDGFDDVAAAPDAGTKTEEKPPRIIVTPITLAEAQSARVAPREILSGLLYADLRLRIAAGGVGKTTLLLFEAASLACGRELYGRMPLLPVRTAIVTREDPREILVARLWKILDAMDTTAAERDSVLANLTIIDLSERSFRLSKINGDIVVPDLANINELADALASWRTDWLSFDPLVSFGVGEQRVNDAEQGLIESFRLLRNRLGCCVEAVHHSGKQNAREGTLDQYSARGGSALPDGARMVAVLQPLGPAEWLKQTGASLADGETGIVMALPKLSYAAAQDPIYIRRRGWAFLYEAHARPMTSQERADDDSQRVLEFVRSAWNEGRRLSGKDIETSRSALGMARHPIREALARLVGAGLVIRHEQPGKTTYYEPTVSPTGSARPLAPDEDLF